MPKRIKLLYDTTADLLDGSAVYLNPDVFNRLLPLASTELFNHLLGRTDEGKAEPSYGFNMRVERALASFLKEQQYTTTFIGAGSTKKPIGADGSLGGPADLVYPTALLVPGALAVDFVDDAHLANRLASIITGPTATNPIVEERPGLGWRLYPTGISAATLKYLALPPEPKYAVQIGEDGVPRTDQNGELLYDDARSVETGWSRQYEPALLMRLLRLLGVGEREGMLQQAATALSQENS